MCFEYILLNRPIASIAEATEGHLRIKIDLRLPEVMYRPRELSISL